MIKLSKIAKTIVEGRSHPISSIYEAEKLLTERGLLQLAVRNYMNGKDIYRGLKDADGEFLIINPKNYTRQSSASSNEYTVVMDNSPYWKGYPKRSKSIICSTDSSTAHNYGKTYVVIPLEKDAKFGMCMDRDVWTTFININKKYKLQIDTFFNSLRGVHKVLCHDDETMFPQKYGTYGDFIKFTDSIDKKRDVISTNDKLDMLDELLAKTSRDTRIMKFIIDWIISKKSLLDFIYQETDPTINYFKLFSYYGNMEYLPYDREVWTDSECLLINKQKWDEFIKTL